MIISSILIKYFGLYIADPICCFLISALILASVVHLVKSTSRVLCLGMADNNIDLSDKVTSAVTEAGQVLAHEGLIDAVYEVNEVLCWEMIAGTPMASVKIKTRVLESRLKAA